MSMKGSRAQVRTKSGNNDSKLHWLVATYDYNGEPSQARLELAKAEYRRRYRRLPRDDDFNVIWVMSQRRKLQIERILRDKAF